MNYLSLADWRHLFLSFEGRISRGPFWVGMVLLCLADYLLEEVAARTGGQRFGALLSLVVFLYPALALTGKRLHDRARSDWLLMVLFGPILLATLLNASGIAFTQNTNDLLETGLSVLVVGSLIWLIVDLGLLAGTEGTNRFGADPCQVVVQ